MSLVAGSAKRMGALTCLDQLDQFGLTGADVVHLDPIAAGQPNQQEFVVRRAKHIGWHGTGGGSPLEGLTGQVDGHQLITVLHRGVDRGAFAVNPDVAGRLAGGQPFGKRQVAAVPAVNIDMVEAVGRGDKPLHVRGKSQLVGVWDAAHGALHFGGFGVDEEQAVTQGVGNQQRFFIGRQVQVVRLFACGNAFDLFPAHRVDHADAGRQRVQHKNWCRQSWQAKEQASPQQNQQATGRQ